MTYVVIRDLNIGESMRTPKLSKLEFRVMEVLWERGPCAIRDILETFLAKKKPAYTTIQTVVYRLEAKKFVRRQAKKIGNFHIFEALISRNAAQRRLMDELLAFFGGSSQSVMAHLIESGKLSLEEIQEAEKTFKRLTQKEKNP
jgi:BlaI family transcriptional regulator, penicillinase repressor